MRATLRLFLGGFMAAGTRRVVFLQCLGVQRSRFRRMATAAAIFAMTTHALEAEAFDMFLMSEGDQLSVIVLGFVGFEDRFLDIWMQYSHDIRRVWQNHRDRIRGLFGMADRALRFMAPFPMTIQALTVVGTLESWLGEVFGAGCAVAVPTGKDLVRRVEMVTQGAATRHLGHLGVQSVGEYDRHILRGKLIHQNHLRSLVRCGTRTWNQTGRFLRRFGAGVAVRTTTILDVCTLWLDKSRLFTARFSETGRKEA